jgi:hypothetical protein
MTVPRLATRLLILSVALVLNNRSGLSQPTTTISRNTCKTCAITVAPPLPLGDADGAGAIVSNPWLACSSKGTFAATNGAQPSEILFFDARAHFQSTVGRKGAGPGEFRAAFPIRFDPFDSLHVFDASNGRRTVIGPDRKVVRSEPFALRISGAVFLRDNGLIVQARPAMPGANDLPLHLVDHAGAIKRSFGIEKPDARPDISALINSRRIAPSRNGVWSLAQNEYRLDEWSADARLLRTLRVPTPWFVPWTTDADDAPPNPVLIAVQEDRDGMLWTLSTVADKRYRAVKVGTPQSQMPPDIEQYDAILETIDPARNTVLASVRLDQPMRGFACEHTMYAFNNDGNSDPRIDVYRFTRK